MDELDVKHYGLGGMGESLLESLVGAGTSIFSATQQKKVQEQVAKAQASQAKAAAALQAAQQTAAQTAALQAQQAQQAAAAPGESKIKKYLPYIAIGAVALGVGIYFMTNRREPS